MRVVVIGGGSAGLTAARNVVELGGRVTLVNDGPPGGDCTWTGCVPSKSLLHAAASGRDFASAMAHMRAAISTVAATEDAEVLAREGIEVIDGRARLLAPDRVEISGQSGSLACDRVIVATGSRPTLPPVPGLAETDPLTNESVFSLERPVGRLAVIGGGAVGCELGQAFSRLGTDVTLLETMPRLLTKEEPEASTVVTEALERDGIRVRTGVAVESVARTDGALRIALAGEDVTMADRVLVAAGRRPSSAGLGLEQIGVTVGQRGEVVVDEALRTSVHGVYAVGDVVGGLAFTHVAGRMGYIAAHNAMATSRLRRPKRWDPTAIPWVTFTDPEVGRVGLTEAEAVDRRPAVRVAELRFEHLDRAITAGRTEGFVKLIAGPRRGLGHVGGGLLLGATVVGPAGGEGVHEAALAMQTKMFVGRLAQTTHAYPSWAMAVQLAAVRFFRTGRDGWRAGRGDAT